MQYLFAHHQNFEDYASGRFFHNLPGQPAFPVRLASEIFQRTLGHWKASDGRVPCRIYDPVCGTAYWLTVLAYLHWEQISALYASDIDADLLTLAERNLSLTTPEGLNRRLNQIKTLLTAYQKESHTKALSSAKTFRKKLKHNLNMHKIESRTFQADALNSESMACGLKKADVDLVFADVPYGWHSDWQMRNIQPTTGYAPVNLMLNALYVLLKPGAMVVVAIDKSQKVGHEKYHRVERFQVGKRRIFILLRP